MKKQIIYIIGISLFFFSCANNKENNSDKDTLDDITLIELNQGIRELYENQMEEKNFQFIINGPCDDALDDTIHERQIPYIDSENLTDSNAIVEFRFISACCQEFLGDYIIQNDTLVFQYEQVNDEVCMCVCWYRYKLIINEDRDSFSTIIIKNK